MDCSSAGRSARARDSFEYVATPKGRDVSPILTALLQWGDTYAAPHGPPRVQVHVQCGHDAHPQLHCSHCGEVIERGQLQSRPGPGATPQQLAEGMLPKTADSANTYMTNGSGATWRDS